MSGRNTPQTERYNWKHGWYPNHMTAQQGPRWTMSRSGKHATIEMKKLTSSQNSFFRVGGGYRSTWFESYTLSRVTPGPGRYRTDTEFVVKSRGKDQVDPNQTVKDQVPQFSFPKGIKETSLKSTKLSILKPSFLNTPVGRSTEMRSTPGPGQYTQYTYFGGASGGHRTPYF